MKEREFINPFTDFGFKRIFGQEINSDDGTQFIVEMQAARQNYFLDRSLYYQSRAIIAQGEKGKDWCYDLQPVYGIFFMDFTISGCSGLRTDVALMDMKTNKVFNPKLRQIYLELPHFTKEANECENDFERWLYLIKNMKILKRMPFKAQRAIWDKLLEVADVASLNEDEQAQYHRALKNYRDYHNVIETAKQDGHEAGWKEGLKEGERKGLRKGEEIGRKEAILQNARNLKQLGVSISIIAQATGLSEEEIQQL